MATQQDPQTTDSANSSSNRSGVLVLVAVTIGSIVFAVVAVRLVNSLLGL